MHFIEERKKNERIPVSYLFSMIKALVALNEKQKAGGKRGGDASGSARLPRRRFVRGGRVKRQQAGQSMDLAGKGVCLSGASAGGPLV